MVCFALILPVLAGFGVLIFICPSWPACLFPVFIALTRQLQKLTLQNFFNNPFFFSTFPFISWKFPARRGFISQIRGHRLASTSPQTFYFYAIHSCFVSLVLDACDFTFLCLLSFFGFVVSGTTITFSPRTRKWVGKSVLYMLLSISRSIDQLINQRSNV